MPTGRLQRRIDAVLDEADSAFAARDRTRLRVLASDVFSLDPENGDAATFLRSGDANLGTGAVATPAMSPAAPANSLPQSFGGDR
jgi:hypothetical protein